VAAAATTDQLLRGEVLALHGKVALDLGSAEEACDLLAGAVAAVAAAGAPTGPVAIDFADAALRVDRADEAADALEEVLSELDGPPGNHGRFLLAKAYRSLGQREAALALCDEVGQFCAADGNPAGVGQMHAMSGAILDELDRDDEAARRFTSAAASFAEAGIAMEVLANRRRAAVSWWWADEDGECLAALSEADTFATGIAEDSPAVTYQKAMLAYDGARVYAGIDRKAEAVDRTVDAVAGFRAVGATEEVAAATVLQGRLLADLDRVDEAKAVLTGVLADVPEDAQADVTALLTALG
jgi:tetratricopeptide (TPR) repeat protein